MMFGTTGSYCANTHIAEYVPVGKVEWFGATFTEHIAVAKCRSTLRLKVLGFGAQGKPVITCAFCLKKLSKERMGRGS